MCFNAMDVLYWTCVLALFSLAHSIVVKEAVEGDQVALIECHNGNKFRSSDLYKFRSSGVYHNPKLEAKVRVSICPRGKYYSYETPAFDTNTYAFKCEGRQTVSWSILNVTKDLDGTVWACGGTNEKKNSSSLQITEYSDFTLLHVKEEDNLMWAEGN